MARPRSVLDRSLAFRLIDVVTVLVFQPSFIQSDLLISTSLCPLPATLASALSRTSGVSNLISRVTLGRDQLCVVLNFPLLELSMVSAVTNPVSTAITQS